eukprot:scaffold908_cov228-Pinguiococcus_pyrenoidosus.AAC.11
MPWLDSRREISSNVVVNSTSLCMMYQFLLMLPYGRTLVLSSCLHHFAFPLAFPLSTPRVLQSPLSTQPQVEVPFGAPMWPRAGDRIGGREKR